jgi:glycosyltransferase involved in cell wall biosynthesis
MIIITYCKTSAETIEQDIGKPEYRYYCFWKKYLPAMEQIGTVVVVRDPAKEVDELYKQYRSQKQQCVFLSFTGPDEILSGLRCPTVCVFDWEYSSIPNEALDGSVNSDWVASLKRVGRTLTLSSYAEEAVKRSISRHYPVETVPAPILSLSGTPAKTTAIEAGGASFELEVRGKVFDSDKFEISYDGITPIQEKDSATCAVSVWDAKAIHHFFGRENVEATQLLVGFYSAEDWGAWSRTTAPWIILPTAVDGKVEINIELVAYGDNINRDIDVALGAQSQKMRVGSQLETVTLEYQLDEPADSLRFSGLAISQTSSTGDHRTLGLGLKSFTISRPGEAGEILEAEPGSTHSERLPLARVRAEGIVYTSEFDPADSNKNWEDILSAFCWVFKDTPDATLILRMANNDISMFLGVLLLRFSELSPFKCRVIAVQGFLDDEQYSNLYNATNYVVNTSYCEGQCLPLMEYMARGIPAISPGHTGMRDYISKDNAFIVDSNTTPTYWPNDKRHSYRTLVYEVNWGSISRAFQESYRVAKEHPEHYSSMGRAAREVMEKNFSVEVVAPKLEAFLQKTCKKRFFFW